MKARTMRKIASWNAKLYKDTFPSQTTTFKSYRFIEGKGWVLVEQRKVRND